MRPKWSGMNDPQRRRVCLSGLGRLKPNTMAASLFSMPKFLLAMILFLSQPCSALGALEREFTRQVADYSWSEIEVSICSAGGS